MKVTVIPIEIGTLRTVPKNLVKSLEDAEIEEQGDTIQTMALLRSALIVRRVLED